MKAVVHLICSADQSDEPEFAFEILLAEEVQNNVALKSSYTKFPSLSSWLFDTMTTSLQMIQCSATANSLSTLAVDKTLDCVAFHMLLCMLQQG